MGRYLCVPCKVAKLKLHHKIIIGHLLRLLLGSIGGLLQVEIKYPNWILEGLIMSMEHNVFRR